MSTNEPIRKFKENLNNLINKRLEHDDYLKNLPRKMNLSRMTFLNDVRNRFRSKDLVLVLGSGVSVSCGLPDWIIRYCKFSN